MIEGLLEKVRSQKPLVHHITNIVTVNDCANVTLAIGALPVMAHALEEVEDMVSAASSLVLNIGTLTPKQVEAMIKAGKKANELGVPVVLDPVGAGATPLRTESARRILKEVKVSVVKGNSAEIGVLAGAGGEIRGVEAVGSSENLLTAAKKMAKGLGSTVVISGVKDIVTDGDRVAYVDNGHRWMGTITGAGCMLASVIGSFCGVERDCFKASIAALVAFGLAGELAAERPEVRGPASFKVCFFDELYNLTEEKIRAGMKYSLA
ncbi:hydroxyethylthiazole kinase [Thermosediminibacter litoriperuensis]|uniref:Hydroxyethylthiazole kinase n=1 Tax=Thermosediminibacter litoriperuensis TaxID=291989 RepID=A0A5S5AUM7_9FIRM|nr:hydroxyethylthiazole kinase [Thermosediminibacter litoriperuensis]TYP56164.1 hydroxyethylthiazole kinase [Thermosediminibacter litoriperuensis]